MNWRALRFAVWFGAGLLVTAQVRADVVTLRDGRTLEGRVLARNERHLVLWIEGAGRLVLEAGRVLRVERADATERVYGDLAARTDMSDPDAVEGLALWCSRRGWGSKAQELFALAKGLRFEAFARRAQSEGTPRAWARVFHWGRKNGLDAEVLLWALDRARRLDPEHPAVRAAEEAFRVDLERRAREAKRRARQRNLPEYVLPGDDERMIGVGVLAEALRARAARAKGPKAEALRARARAAREREVARRRGLRAREREEEATRRRRREAAEEQAAAEEAARWARERADAGARRSRPVGEEESTRGD
ncbi:MAG: hypothetical protein D6731_12470 [Planctomycetota bacterium]|nr:MAG: hypothetical protein D6731_12470 [Planctomycetota bacterium]